MVWFKLIFLLFFSFPLSTQDLSSVEQSYFNFFDINNDNSISYEEINKAISLVFQLIDKNQNSKISKQEIKELKEIFQLLR